MLLDSDLEFYLPSTSPNQFDPDKMLESCERIEALNVSKIFFGHFGMSEHPEEVYKQLKYWLDIFVDQGKAVVKSMEACRLKKDQSFYLIDCTARCKIT